MTSGEPRVLGFATQGAGSSDEQRLRELLEPLGPSIWPFDRGRKLASAAGLVRRLAGAHRPDVVVMEGTGLAGGAALIVARRLLGTRYVVSSGDAVGPFIAAHRPSMRLLAGLYEQLLCRWSAGFIGWSPYLVGRALSKGAPRAMTAAGWAPEGRYREDRKEVRRELGIPDGTLVFGIVGSVVWNPHRGYCYGSELVRAVRASSREDVVVLIAGDGTGSPFLRDMAGPEIGGRVRLLGRVPRDKVPGILSAIDVASLPQSVDRVGSFRLTTKLSEYLRASLPVVTGELPLAYDLDEGFLWRLPGDAPWDPVYVQALTDLMQQISREAVDERRALVPQSPALFDRVSQQRRAAAFIRDVSARATG